MAITYNREPASKPRPRKPKQETPGVGHNAAPNWKNYVGELDDYEHDLEQAQTGKRDIYKSVREVHGKLAADSLKNAMRIRRMKAEKRAHSEQVDDLTLQILNSLGGGLDSKPDVEHARGAPAPRQSNSIQEKPEIGAAAGHAVEKTPQPDAEPMQAPAPIHPKPKEAGPAPAFLLREGVRE